MNRLFQWVVAGWLAWTGAAVQAAAPSVPPLPPLTTAPMDFFRNLLATNAAGRAAFLADRSPEQRRILEIKIAEYQALPPDERELRLVATDLRHYLSIFLRWPVELRSQLLTQVPAKYRAFVMERLKTWDALTPEAKQEFLENETALSFIVRLSKATPPKSQQMLADLPAKQRAEMEAVLKTWQATSPSRRQAQIARFNQFFELTEQEKQQTLAALPADQRVKPQRILALFERLPKDDRQKCAEALNQFLAMSPEEREQFLRNAARWQAMSAQERQAVRDMVLKFPPLPPGFLDATGGRITAMPTNHPRVN